MKDNLLIFKDQEIHIEIRYVIAYYAKNHWYHYLDYPNIDDAKEQLEKIRKQNHNMKFGLFEKIEQISVNKIEKDNF